MPCTDEHCTNPHCTDPRCQGTPTRDRIAAAIREHGQLIMAVLGGDERRGFAYTIGRTERDLPELLVFADTVEELMERGGMLNYLGPRDVKHGQFICSTKKEVFCATDMRDFPEVVTAAHEDLVVQADHYYGRPVGVLFVVLLKDQELLKDLELDLSNEAYCFTMPSAPGVH